MDAASPIASACRAFVEAIHLVDEHAPSLNKTQANKIAKQLIVATNICTEAQIQVTTTCMNKYLLPSAARTRVLVDFLLALSKSFKPRPADYEAAMRPEGLLEDEGLQPVDGVIKSPMPSLKRLHVLLMLNDAVQAHKQSFTTSSSSETKAVANMVDGALVDLFRLAACCRHEEMPEISQALHKLIASWRLLPVFGDADFNQLKDTANKAIDRTFKQALAEVFPAGNARGSKKKARNETLPIRHGVRDDPNAPWNELPAANGLYLKHMRGYPLRAGAFPRGGFQVRSGGQEPSNELQLDVQWLYTEMLHAFDDHTNPDEVQDIDPLGNKVWKDPERPTRNYWGFTYDGLEKTRENNKKRRMNAQGYEEVGPVFHNPYTNNDPMDEVDSAVARAKALAGGRGMGGRGRGGRGGQQWRGNGNGFRGGPRGGPPTRY